MTDKITGMLGLMRRANALQLGEENTGAAVKAGKAKLLLIASDASENAAKRAEGFVYGRNVLYVLLPYTKRELSDAVGAPELAMAAVTDMGFADSLMKLLAQQSPEQYAQMAASTTERLDKVKRRKKSTAAGSEKTKNGFRRNNI